MSSSTGPAQRSVDDRLPGGFALVYPPPCPAVANVSIWGQRDTQLQVLFDPKLAGCGPGVTLEQGAQHAGDATWTSLSSFLGGIVTGSRRLVDIAKPASDRAAPCCPSATASDPGAGSRRGTGGRQAHPARPMWPHIPKHPAVARRRGGGHGSGLIMVVEKLPGAKHPCGDQGYRRRQWLDVSAGACPALTVDTTILPTGHVHPNSAEEHRARRAHRLLAASLWIGIATRSWRRDASSAVIHHRGCDRGRAHACCIALGATMNMMNVGRSGDRSGRGRRRRMVGRHVGQAASSPDHAQAG